MPFWPIRWRIKTEGLSVSVDIPDQDLVVLSGLVGGFRKYGDGDTLRAANLAHNFQLAWEAAIVELCSNIYQLGYSKNLCFSGGCALNSSANGKLIPASGFERLHVPSARMYADARVQRIYAGANEVMKELIARSL